MEPPGLAQDFEVTNMTEQEALPAADGPQPGASGASASAVASAATTAATAAAAPAQASNSSVIVIPYIDRCAARNSAATNTSSSSTTTNTMKFALNVSSAVGLLTGFPPGCFPTNPEQLQTSTHVLVFTTQLCSIPGAQIDLLRYTHAQLFSAAGRPLRNANNTLCALRNTARLAPAIAARLFGTGCGVAPAVGNGTLPQAVCVEQQCSSSGGADPSNVGLNTTSSSSSTSPAPAVPASSPDVSTVPADSVEIQKGGGRRPGSVEVASADAAPAGVMSVPVGTFRRVLQKGGGRRRGSADAASADVTSADVASAAVASVLANSVDSQKGGGRRLGSTDVTPSDVNACKGGGRRPGCVASDGVVAPCKGGGRRPGFVGKNELSNVVIGPLCCADATMLNPVDSKASPSP